MALSLPAFEAALGAWSGALAGVPAAGTPWEAVSIDGKTLCGTLRPYTRALHLLSALDQRTGCVLSQTVVDEKTSEAKAALGLLKGLVLRGRVVVGDAMFCQREICRQALDSGGHYLFVVKENQPTLLKNIEAAFVEEAAFSLLGGSGNSVRRGRRPRRGARGTGGSSTGNWSAARCPMSLSTGREWPRSASGAAPLVLAAVRNAAIGLPRFQGVTNIAQALRQHAFKVDRLFARLGRWNK